MLSCVGLRSAVIGLSLACVAPAPADDAVLRDEFARGVREGWAAYKATFEDFGGGFREDRTTWLPDRPAKEESRRITYCLRPADGVRSVRAERTAGGGGVSVSAANSRYGFEVAADQGVNAFRMTDYSDSSRGGELWTPRTDESSRVDIKMENLDVPYRITYRLDQMLDDPQFALRTISRVRHDGKDMVRVEFDRTWTEGDDPGVPYPEWAVVNPAENWIIYECLSERTWGSQSRRYEYQTTAEGLPFPLKITEELTDKKQGGRLAARTVSTYDPPGRCDAPESEFTLAAYGLPEIEGEAERGVWWWLLWVGLAVAAVALIVWVSRRERRNESGRPAA